MNSDQMFRNAVVGGVIGLSSFLIFKSVAFVEPNEVPIAVYERVSAKPYRQIGEAHCDAAGTKMREYDVGNYINSLGEVEITITVKCEKRLY